MRLVIFKDFHKRQREVGKVIWTDICQWNSTAIMGQSYEVLADAVLKFKSCKAIAKSSGLGKEELRDLSRDLALELWQHMKEQQYADPWHAYNAASALARHRLIDRLRRRSPKTFGSYEELLQLGFKDQGDGGLGATIFALDLLAKLKQDQPDYITVLASDCLTNERVTIREIQEYAGFSNYQARQLKEIMVELTENYCGIS